MTRRVKRALSIMWKALNSSRFTNIADEDDADDDEEEAILLHNSDMSLLGDK